ncbi:hypothetical protein BH11ARM1_BH11ARM1_17110 [soil metagenome]
MNRTSGAWFAVPAVLMLVTLSSDAHGYIDSGSGSYLVQMLLAGALGASFMARNVWTIVKAKFTRSEVRQDEV